MGLDLDLLLRAHFIQEGELKFSDGSIPAWFFIIPSRSRCPGDLFKLARLKGG